ncbi:tyrosine-type recombinase/integrase [Paraburkholderia saeva]|uniref:tyrosine-type recombinase/integrase n=1 Tax=Paraburkholderia saeva TaxID=2777537 RepID=UPI001D505BE0|nr:site-specific integrase [Paraburkholderia saeva]CAG4920213.1 Prophage integrase IntA [Paraburkholderia saeva]
MATLTTKELQALTSSDDGRRLTDGHGVFGVVRVGAKSISVHFSLRYRSAGAIRELRLGTFPKSTLRQIRDARDSARAQINEGEDPLEHKRIERLRKQVEVDAAVSNLEERLARKTFRQRFNEWIDSALQKRADGGQEVRRAFEKDILPVVGDMAMEDVRRSHLISSLDTIVARGANRLANRMLTDLKQFIKWCQVREYVSVDPLLTIVKKDVGGADGERERTLSKDEIRALPGVLECANLLETTKRVLMLILATNARVGEVIKARKQDINLELKIWRIPFQNAKNRESHIVFLSDFALQHMRVLFELSDSKEWLLPGLRRENEPETHVGLKSITKQVSDRQLVFYEREAHAKRASNGNSLVLSEEKWTPHDLRRTAATLMQELGVLPAVIDKCMNHREQNRMKRIYQRYPYTAEKREAWRLLGAHLGELTAEDADKQKTEDSSSDKESSEAVPGETTHLP